MEGFPWRGLLAPSALPGKAAAAEGRNPPACHGDNVLGGHAAEATSVVPARPEEYQKVFGAASACSIPVLELPPPSDGCDFLGCSALDYLDIFGGFDGHDFGVPYEELFFAANQVSGGVGAPPPPPAPGDPAPLPANTCTSRWSEEISCLTEEIPFPEWPGGDNIWSSSSEVAHHLSDGTKQTNMSCQMASWSSKDDPVNWTLHRNQMHAISGSTIVVEHPITNIPNNHVVTDICPCPSGSKETMKGQHLKKTMLSTSSCSNMKYLQIDMMDEPRPSKLEFSASKIAVYEQNESVISSNQSTFSRSNAASANLSNNHSLCEDFVEKKTEGRWQKGTAQSTVMSVKSGNDLKVQCIASEHIPAKEALSSCSYSDHAASSSPELFPSHLATDINLDAADAKVAKANHFKKFMSPSPSCASSQSSDYDNKVEEKQLNTMPKFLEMSPVNENYRSHVSNDHSISSWCRTYPDAAFLTVSDVILQTQPSQGPPPSRPPPARPTPCSDLDACRPSANCHRATFTSHSSKQVESDISPPCFGAGVNESSRAVASVAAVEEAMELAQARVKNTKLSMDGKDNLQINLKSGVSYGQRSAERDEDKAIQDNQRNREDIVVHLAQKNNDDEVHEFSIEKMTREIRVPRQAANFTDKEGNCGPIDWSLQEMQLEEVSENTFVYKETEKKMTLTEKFLEGHKELNNQKAWSKSFDQDVNEKELEVHHASCVFAEDIALTWKNQEDMSFNCIMTDEYACFHEGNEIEPEEARLLFEQYKSRKSNITQQTFEEAGNEIELEAACEVHYHKGNSGKIYEVQQSHGWNSNESISNEVQQLPLSPEEDHRHKHAEPSIALVAGIPDAVEHSIVAAQGDCKKKINDSIKEVQVVLDPRQAMLLGKQWHIYKAGRVSIEKNGAGWLDENVSEAHETKEEVNKERIEKELPKNLQKMERDRRKLERNEWPRIKSGEKERKRIELEEEKEGERIKMEEKNDRMRRYIEEEKDLERTLEEEKEGERMSRDAKDEKRKYEGEEKEKKYQVEEKERRKTDEEREKDEEQERRKLEEEETERRKLDKKEGVKRKLDKERRERKKLEDKEGEMSKLIGEGERRLEEGEKERRKLEEKGRERRTTEEEDGDTKLEGQKDRRKIEEKEREGRMEREREMERKMMEEEKESERMKSEAEMDNEWGREDRQAVEREVHERAFMGIRERAERVAVEMVATESQHKAVAEAQGKGEKTSAESLEKSLADKASRVAKLRAEHAAERAMPEAQESALGMSVAEKTTHDTRECAEKFSSTSTEGLKTNGNLSDMWDTDPQFQNLDASSSNCQGFSESFDAKAPTEKLGGSEVESSIRCKARMERHQRTSERVAKALSEKNMRDIIAQREQAERNRLAETLDADVRRWSNGKEGNLRALLSTLQYILGPESGWQPIPLTDVITASAVKKAYRKAMLYVHPDKLQQRSANVQQKYISEKVFDLLKDAWNKFNSEEW